MEISCKKRNTLKLFIYIQRAKYSASTCHRTYCWAKCKPSLKFKPVTEEKYQTSEMKAAENKVCKKAITSSDHEGFY